MPKRLSVGYRSLPPHFFWPLASVSDLTESSRGASDKGTWVRISAPTAEGKVVRGFEGLDVGDHVPVQLLHTDVEKGFIDFAKLA